MVGLLGNGRQGAQRCGRLLWLAMTTSCVFSLSACLGIPKASIAGTDSKPLDASPLDASPLDASASDASNADANNDAADSLCGLPSSECMQASMGDCSQTTDRDVFGVWTCSSTCRRETTQCKEVSSVCGDGIAGNEPSDRCDLLLVPTDEARECRGTVRVCGEDCRATCSPRVRLCETLDLASGVILCAVGETRIRFSVSEAATYILQKRLPNESQWTTLSETEAFEIRSEDCRVEVQPLDYFATVRSCVYR